MHRTRGPLRQHAQDSHDSRGRNYTRRSSPRRVGLLNLKLKSGIALLPEAARGVKLINLTLGRYWGRRSAR